MQQSKSQTWRRSSIALTLVLALCTAGMDSATATTAITSAANVFVGQSPGT